MRPPDVRLWQRDETRYWCDKLVLASCSPLIGRYLVDVARRTYCCSLTPSYEMWSLDTEPGRAAPIWRFEDDEFRDRLLDRIRQGDADNEGVSYFTFPSGAARRCPVIYAPSRSEWEEFLQDDDRRYWRVRLFDHCRELLSTGAVSIPEKLLL